MQRLIIDASDRVLVDPGQLQRVFQNLVENSIEPRYHERVFDMFMQIDQGEGTGIGLAVVKRVVQMNGGILSVDSDGSYWNNNQVHAACGFCSPIAIAIVRQ